MSDSMSMTAPVVKRYVIQIREGDEWRDTNWTHRGLPASYYTALKHLEEAKRMHPGVEFKMKEKSA